MKLALFTFFWVGSSSVSSLKEGPSDYWFTEMKFLERSLVDCTIYGSWFRPNLPWLASLSSMSKFWIASGLGDTEEKPRSFMCLWLARFNSMLYRLF